MSCEDGLLLALDSLRTSLPSPMESEHLSPFKIRYVRLGGGLLRR
jgi:hypothetical protein